MRIISQGGHADLPYERTCIMSHTENVLARCDGKEYLMGIYSTKEKAMKAMEMCRNRYLSRIELQGGFDAVNGRYVQPNFWVLPRIFQFPQDNEIEV